MSDTTETEDFTHLILQPEPETDEGEVAESEAEEVEPEALDAEGEADTEQPDDEGEEAPEEEAPATPVFKVKVDGEELEVTQDELIRGYSGQAKIQKGLMELAETRKAAASEIKMQREAVLELVQDLQSRGGIMPAPKQPDPALANTDPVGYVRANAKYQAELAEYMTQQQRLEQLNAHQIAQQRQEADRMREEGFARLVELIPDLQDAEKAPVVQRMLLKAGEAYGYTADDIGSVLDPRALKVLHDAAQWRQAEAARKAARSKVADKVAKAQPVLRPNAKTQGPAITSQKLADRMKRAPTDDNIAGWILNP